MEQPNQPSKEQYAGPSRATVVLGRGGVYGWIGSAVGVVVGGVISAFSTNHAGHYTEEAGKLLNKVGIKLNGRWAIIAGGSLAGYVVGHYSALLLGLRAGAKEADQGRIQFEEIKGERDEALAALTAHIEHHHPQSEVPLAKEEKHEVKKADKPAFEPLKAVRVEQTPSGTKHVSSLRSAQGHAAAVASERASMAEALDTGRIA